jgi:hypothetical protein
MIRKISAFYLGYRSGTSLFFDGSSSDQILYDVLTPTLPRCYAATCNPNSPGNPDHPSRGGEGSTGFGSQEVPLYQNDTGNLYFFTGVSGPKPDNNGETDIRIGWQDDALRLITSAGENSIAQVVVYDLSGRMRKQYRQTAHKEIQLDMQGLSPGVYLLFVGGPSGEKCIKVCKP